MLKRARVRRLIAKNEFKMCVSNFYVMLTGENEMSLTCAIRDCAIGVTIKKIVISHF